MKKLLLLMNLVTLIMTFSVMSTDTNVAQLKSEKNEQCNLLHTYKVWLTYLKTFPKISNLRKSVDFDEYIYVAKSVKEESDLSKKRFGKEYIELMANNFLFASVWIDSRNTEIKKYKQVCHENKGELITLYKSVSGENLYDVIPFTFNGEMWIRGFSITSGYSYLLQESAEDILKNGPRGLKSNGTKSYSKDYQYHPWVDLMVEVHPS